MSHERQRNEDARGGDVIVQDSIASGRPDLPIDQDPGRETNVAIDADRLGHGAASKKDGDAQAPPDEAPAQRDDRSR